MALRALGLRALARQEFLMAAGNPEDCQSKVRGKSALRRQQQIPTVN